MFDVVVDFFQRRAAKQVLQRAKALIEKGWTQRLNYRDDTDGNRSYCALGGLYEGVWKSPNRMVSAKVELRAMNALSKAVAGGVGGSYGSVISFNDTPGRTKEEVLAKFDEAISLL
jgi:hypothetical protein